MNVIIEYSTLPRKCERIRNRDYIIVPTFVYYHHFNDLNLLEFFSLFSGYQSIAHRLCRKPDNNLRIMRNLEKIKGVYDALSYLFRNLFKTKSSNSFAFLPYFKGHENNHIGCFLWRTSNSSRKI